MTQAHIDAAIDFILAVNTRPRAALATRIGCLLLAFRHIATVERRVERLKMLDPQRRTLADVQSFVSMRLLPAWDAVSRGL